MCQKDWTLLQITSPAAYEIEKGSLSSGKIYILNNIKCGITKRPDCGEVSCFTKQIFTYTIWTIDMPDIELMSFDKSLS